MESPAVMMAQVKNLKDNLLTYQFNLQNDVETLKLCENSVDFDNIPEQSKKKLKLLIKGVIEKINYDQSEISTFISKIEAAQQLQSSDIEQFNLIKLRYNKMIIQVEKVFSCTPSFSEISSKVPKRIAQGDAYSAHKSVDVKRPERASPQKQTYDRPPDNRQVLQDFAENQNWKSRQGQATQGDSKQDAFTANYQKHLSQQHILTQQQQNYNSKALSTNQQLIKNTKLFYESYDKDFIKKELNQVKNMIIDVKKKMDTHDHAQYEQELEQVKSENTSMLQEYQILKHDNTEIAHEIQQLMKLGEQIILQNERLLDNITEMKGGPSQPTSYQNKASNGQAAHYQAAPNLTKKQMLSLLPQKEIQSDDLLASWARRKLQKKN